MNKWMIPLALLIAAPAHAEWDLNGEQSALSFVSTKAINMAEVHQFGTLSGGVDADGMVSVTIDLGSVDTSIELRDDRMREMLFDTENHPTAEVSAKVDSAVVNALQPGESTDMNVEANLSLHGSERRLAMDVKVARVGDHSLLVTTNRPVIVNAWEFALGEGVEALRAIAGLDSISMGVPVSFVLAFDEE
ncbi:MAG: YceI family protein [Pseudomonadota bacterium]|jgi:polyisoprenoid-binding protein YceI|nr:YceI family protein [Pseudomonadota bacterium]